MASLVLVLLAGATAAGFDVRYALLSAIDSVLGIDAVMRFVTLWLPAHFFALSDTLPGPLTLLYLLPALHIAPGRRPWWLWTSLIVAAIALPVLRWLALPWVMRYGAPSYHIAFLELAVVIDVLLIGGLYLLTRSRMVLAVSLVATALGCVAEGASLSIPYVPVAFGWIWHAVLAATLLTWAIKARHYRLPAHLCVSCGYDLTGVAAPVCPECGQARN